MFSLLLVEDEKESMRGYEYVAMFANAELYSKLKGWDKGDAEYQHNTDRPDEPELRNASIGKEFKEIFGTDIKEYLKASKGESDEDDWENDDDIIELK